MPDVWDQIPSARPSAPRVSPPPVDPWAARPPAKAPVEEPSLWDTIKNATTAVIGTGAAAYEAFLRQTNPDALVDVAMKVAPTAVRVVPAVAGGIVGALGGPAGFVAGGAGGAGLGELIAEGIEIGKGDRGSVNPTQIAVQSALGAVPVAGKVGSVVGGVVKRGAQGALLGGAGAAATELAEGQTPSVSSVATGMALGAGLGGPLGALEGRAASRALPKSTPNLSAEVSPPATHAPDVSMDPSTPPGQPPIHTTGGLSHGTGPAFSADELAKARAQLKMEADAKAGVTAPPVRSDVPKTADIESAARQAGDPIPAAKPLPDARKVEERMVDQYPEPMRDEARRLIEEHGGFESARRGVQPIERQQALAEYITVEAQKAKPGTILNTEQTIALGGKLVSVSDEIDTLVAKVTAKEASPKDLLRLKQLQADAVVLWANELGNAAEQGRALGARRFMREALQSHDDQLLAAALKNVHADEIEAFAAKWAALPDDLSKMKFLRDLQKLTKWEAFQAVRYAGMLSGVKTTLRNLIGSTANIGFRVASHVPATMYDVARSATTGAPRTTFLGELAPELVGGAVGFKRGIDSFLTTLKHGFNPEGLSAFDIPRKELRGGGKNPFNYPGRFLEAQDAWMYSTVYNAEVASRSYAAARAEGLAQGLRGKALAAHIKTATADALLTPSSKVSAKAREAALQALYREDGGPAVQWFLGKKRAGGVGKALEFLVPFAKVPANLIRQSVENVPGGAFVTQQGRAAMKAGGRESAEMVGRMATGGIALGALAYWASQGKVSGAGPSNPAERARLMAEGWRPNSVKIGDTWVEYAMPFQAISGPLYAVANLWERMHETGKAPSEKDVSDYLNGLFAGALGAGQSVLDQSFLSGVSDFNNALNDPARYASSYVGRQAQMVVPFAGMARNVAQAVDPTIREPKNPVESVKSIIPGVSKAVEPKLDIFGAEATRTGTAAERGFSPVGRSPESKDPVVLALRDLGISMGVPQKTLSKTRTQPAITLTTDERKSVGLAARKAADQLVTNSAFQAQMKRAPEQAGAALKAAMDRARDAVYTQIRLSRRRPTPR